MSPKRVKEIFDEPGDHAGELETSFLLHVRPEWVAPLNEAGEGRTIPVQADDAQKARRVDPAPWSATHPDTGSGNPSQSTAEKGRRYFEAISKEVADVLVELSKAKKGELPYV